MYGRNQHNTVKQLSSNKKKNQTAENKMKGQLLLMTISVVVSVFFPGTGEPGGLPSMGSHRVGHD